MNNALTMQIAVISGIFFIFTIYVVFQLVRIKPETNESNKAKIYDIRKHRS